MARRIRRPTSSSTPDVDPVLGFRALRQMAPRLNGFIDQVRELAWQLQEDSSLSEEERFSRLYRFFGEHGRGNAADRILERACDPARLERNRERRGRLAEPDFRSLT
jgi:hypothetical protein